jgi:hypothetical protein
MILVPESDDVIAPINSHPASSLPLRHSIARANKYRTSTLPVWMALAQLTCTFSALINAPPAFTGTIFVSRAGN